MAFPLLCHLLPLGSTIEFSEQVEFLWSISIIRCENVLMLLFNPFFFIYLLLCCVVKWLHHEQHQSENLLTSLWLCSTLKMSLAWGRCVSKALFYYWSVNLKTLKKSLKPVFSQLGRRKKRLSAMLARSAKGKQRIDRRVTEAENQTTTPTMVNRNSLSNL